MSTSEDEFDNEWLCPYCTALTQPADKSCPKCRRSLIVSKRVNPERSPWLWRGFFLQQVVAIGLLAVGAAYYTLALKWRGMPDPVPFLPLYVALPVDQPPALAQAALIAFPPVVFWSFIGAAIYSVVLMAVLYLRVPFGNVLYLINAGVLLLLGVIGLLLFFNSGTILTIAVVGVLLGLGQLLITFNLWNDFTFKATRLRLKVDTGVKNHTSFFLSGRRYSELGMWGAALIHLRRAVVRNPTDLTYRLALTVAYINLARYELAQQEIDEIKALAPHSDEVRRLESRLSTLKVRHVSTAKP